MEEEEGEKVDKIEMQEQQPPLEKIENQEGHNEVVNENVEEPHREAGVQALDGEAPEPNRPDRQEPGVQQLQQGSFLSMKWQWTYGPTLLPWNNHFLSMKWQWTYGPTLLPWNNHFHTSEACLKPL